MIKKMSNQSHRVSLLLMIAILLFSTSFIFAQKKVVETVEKKVEKKAEKKQVDKKEHLMKMMKIESTVLEETRIVSIVFPANYKETKQKYPVLYLLDGKAHVEHATAAVNFLSNRGVIPQMIIVAVHNVDRSRDFSPVYDERIPTSGGAEKFLKFLSEELTPFIEEKLRVSNFSILMGHSFGGTFATYSLLTQPELFDGYIAISPYIHYVDKHLVKEAKTKLQSEYDSHKFFYMTVGDEPAYFEALGEFSSLVKEKSAKAIDFKYTKMEAENHTTIPYLSVFNGLRFIFSDWQLVKEDLEGGLSAIDDHYKTISAKYMMKMSTPENVINALGYNYLQKEEIDAAIKVFTENVKRYPKSANVYDSLGEAFENDEQYEKALKNYQKAFELGTAQDHANTAVYKKNMKRMKEK